MSTPASKWNTLADGSLFPFWEDRTVYGRVYHVAQTHPDADDDNPGTASRPLKTIARAAALLQPAEKVVIHEGCYRECVRPARGGTDSAHMIAYEAAPGEQVVITATEPWQPASQPSDGWHPGKGATATPWMAELPEGIFADYNPFLARNAYDYLPLYGRTSEAPWLARVLRRRGCLYVDGRPLTQVCHVTELATTSGAFWVEEPGHRLHVRLPDDAGPSAHVIEFSAREQVFAPRARHLGFIRVSGFAMRHAANGLPVPQRGALSTNRGHHWIVEDCTIEWANGCGMDIGCQSWDSTVPAQTGHHVIRRNTIRHCGVCGIAGARGVINTLVERNVIEHIGFQNLERMWECAGIKFHFSEHCLIRGNVLRHLQHAAGIWLDVDNVNTRVANNVFADIESLGGGLYSELNYAPTLVDHNVFWNIRQPAAEPAPNTSFGAGVHCDCNEAMICAHNVFGDITGDAIQFSLKQSERRSSGRTGLCWANRALNNVLVRCPNRLHIGRQAENRSDGNLYDSANDDCSFELGFPAPGTRQNLAGWQTYFGYDRHSTQAAWEVAFDVATLCLTWRLQGPAPQCQSVGVPGWTDSPVPGPLAPDPWRQSLSGEQSQQTFPR